MSVSGYLSFLDTIEPWKEAHEKVMEQYRQADALSVHLGVLIRCLDDVKSLESRSREAGKIESPEEVIEACEFYARWSGIAGLMATAANSLQNSGFEVPNYGLLMEKVSEVNRFASKLEEQATRLRRMLAGDACTLKEVLANVGTSAGPKPQ